MKQITFTPCNHQLTNINTWTPDSQWLVFDIRPSGASFAGEIIERVNIHTGKLEVIYRATQRSHVGVMTVHPKSEKYVFIHGLENPDETWHYDFHHRRRVIVTQAGVENLDAMDIIAPYTPGVLRGGSHVYIFSPNGEFVSFVYNDHVLHERSPALNLHNVGVAAPYGPMKVSAQHPREYSGSHWCVLVSQTTPTPKPSGDEINRAYEEGWVGENKLAFIGDMLSTTGEKAPELLIVDLPQSESSWKQPGNVPLEGTDMTTPAPPSGIRQHRLTFTHEYAFPGLVNQSRHWVCSNPKASETAFLMRDDNGTIQLWLISPQGGLLRQLTQCVTNIRLAFNWHPSGKWLGFVLENRIACCGVQTGGIDFLTERHGNPPSADAIIFSPDGRQVAWMEDVKGFRQLWVTETGR